MLRWLHSAQPPPTEIGDWMVLRVEDRQDENGVFGPIRSETDRASRNVLVYLLNDNARVIIRPSGTEPRCKIYVETSGEVGGDLTLLKRRLSVESKTIAHAFTQLVLRRIDIDLPTWALEISDLAAIEDRVRWCRDVIPALSERIENDPDEALSWLKNQLDADERTQLKPGIEALARSNRVLGEALLPYFS